MAMIFPYFELAASLFILLLAFEILTRHYDNRLARFYSFFALVAFLAAILTYSFRIAFTLELARDINRISATLWAFTFALFAHFSLVFTKKDKFLANPLSYVLLYLPPTIIGFLFIFTNQMYLRHEIQNIGIISQPSPFYLLFALETLFYNVWAIILLFQYSRKAAQKSERNQAFLIAIGAIIPLAIGVLSDQLIPCLVGCRLIIPTVVFDMAILNYFIFLAMRRYSLFAISPALAAETIIETMPDSLMVTDLDGRILFLNEEAHKFFHVPKEEIIGKLICSLFHDREKFDKLYTEVVDKRLEIECFEAELVDPLGERIPALINANTLRERGLGELLGIVFVIRDIRG